MGAYRLLQNLYRVFTNRLHFWISPHGVPLSFLTWEKLRNKLAVYQAYYLKGAMWKATFL